MDEDRQFRFTQAINNLANPSEQRSTAAVGKEAWLKLTRDLLAVFCRATTWEEMLAGISKRRKTHAND